ncbi:hypothetical protein CSOJ01_12462 [Colletotrichum sojae]|uniref:Uncharacterized protein n=1 Tax=Colletotrichum sojae TaxID=2175907 RepID=A0A8H6MLS7_9PEZI|nr:hypothetical protein CSOJ01_12462 [Colletotrichum sojae]
MAKEQLFVADNPRALNRPGSLPAGGRRLSRGINIEYHENDNRQQRLVQSPKYQGAYFRFARTVSIQARAPGQGWTRAPALEKHGALAAAAEADTQKRQEEGEFVVAFIED